MSSQPRRPQWFRGTSGEGQSTLANVVLLRMTEPGFPWTGDLEKDVKEAAKAHYAFPVDANVSRDMTNNVTAPKAGLDDAIIAALAQHDIEEGR